MSLGATPNPALLALAKELLAAGSNYYTACEMAVEAELKLRRFLPSAPSDLLLDISEALREADGLALALEILNDAAVPPPNDAAVPPPNDPAVPPPNDPSCPMQVAEKLLEELGLLESPAGRLLAEMGLLEAPKPISADTIGIRSETRESPFTDRILSALDTFPEGIDRQSLAGHLGVGVGKISSSLTNLHRWGWVTRIDNRWVRTTKTGTPDPIPRTKQDPRIVLYILNVKSSTFTTSELAAALQKPGISLSSSLASLARRGLILKTRNNGTWEVVQEEASRLLKLGWFAWFEEGA